MLCTYFQFNSIKCIIYLYNITFRLTNVIPERIIFVSRGITVFLFAFSKYCIPNEAKITPFYLGGLNIGIQVSY